MWLKRDDGVLLVRRGAVKPQMVPIRRRPTTTIIFTQGGVEGGRCG